MVSAPYRAFAAALALLVAGAALAQYPSRPIRIVNPVAPGGAPDIAARVVGIKLSEALGQGVVVENRAGSNGIIAMDVVANAPADGYTLFLGADSNIAINPHIYRKLPLDTLRDLVPVASIAANQFVLSVNPSVPANSLQEFIELARRASPPLAYASAGNGSQHQLSMEMLKQRAGIDLVHVPYRGGALATTATVAGETAAMFAGTSTAPQIKAGRLRALAVTGKKRSALFPDLPTIGELYPGYEVTIWLGLFARTGTPEPAIALLRAELKKILVLPDIKHRLNAAGGLEPFVSSPEEFAALIRSDYDKYAKVVREIGIKVD